MLIIYKKTTLYERDQQTPLPVKLRRILLMRVKEAKTEQDRERAKRDLNKLSSD
jgi:hypothetical protein